MRIDQCIYIHRGDGLIKKAKQHFFFLKRKTRNFNDLVLDYFTNNTKKISEKSLIRSARLYFNIFKLFHKRSIIVLIDLEFLHKMLT